MTAQIPIPRTQERLYYLDWLRVIAILGVFLFHSVHPFDFMDWHIKNSELSEVITIILAFFSLWGMPFFFLVAGAGTWFALRKRTSRQFIGERTRRLLIPYFFGALLFMPIMLYFEWLYKAPLGLVPTRFMEFVLDRNPGFTPRWFGSLGYHLWFLGFLWSFSLLGLPLFNWLRKLFSGTPAGQPASTSGQTSAHSIRVERFLRLLERRGGILLLVIPLIVIQLLLRPFFLDEHDWSDFIFEFAFFVLGFLLFTHPRITTAVRRDGWISFGAALAAFVIVLALFFVGEPFDWSEQPSNPWFYPVWILVTLNSWFWCTSVLAWGMRKLDFTNRTLTYLSSVILPFFLVHQPVIIVIAFYVVQWNASIAVKLPAVVISSFLVSIGLVELVIRRVALLRRLTGMEAGAPPQKSQ